MGKARLVFIYVAENYCIHLQSRVKYTGYPYRVLFIAAAIHLPSPNNSDLPHGTL